MLTIDTQFGDPPIDSPVVNAAAALSTCTHARDLTSKTDESDPSAPVFTGSKQLVCAGGRVTIAYEVTMEIEGRTAGTWRITDSTLADVESGSGALEGGSSPCTTVLPAEGCIRDIYKGSVGG